MASQPIAPIEIGSFTASSRHKTEFLGSASGVFFVKTVFRAFARSASGTINDKHSNTAQQPSQRVDDESVSSRLIDPETPARPDTDSPVVRIELEDLDRHPSATSPRTYGIKGHGLGIAPKQEVAQELFSIYLRNWHPLFPFLHGPTLLDTMLSLYENDVSGSTQSARSLQDRICKAVICQCVFNIAAVDWRDQQLAVESRIASPMQILSLLGFLASNHDLQSLQALLAAELYLLCTMSLRAASTIGGTLTRLIYHAGLHRCPCRYVQIPAEECDMRKRIFWTAYILDRYLSQALGHPLSFQDSELDVCIPGQGEYHKRVMARPHNPNSALAGGDDVLDHLPQTQADERQTAEGHERTRSSDLGGARSNDESSSRPHREDHGHASEILGHYVLYCRLTGQALEMFHKSLQNRTINRESIMELQSNVHAWWNELPAKLQNEYADGQGETPSAFTFFFNPIYNQLILLINRPFLSLPPHSIEFRLSLHNCINAARQIITSSKRQVQAKIQVSWPGMLSMSKAQQEIEDCVHGLLAMDQKWNNARHCAAALKSLLGHLSDQYRDSSRQLRMEHNNPSAPEASSFQRKRLTAETIDLDPDLRSAKRANRASSSGPSSSKNSDNNQVLSQSQRVSDVQFSDAQAPPMDFSANDSVFGQIDPQYSQVNDGDFLSMPTAAEFYGNLDGGFGNIEWESMANNWGSFHDWGSWDMPDLWDQ
ncbi:hypothetical protein LTR84_008585 [Exophiala bonariae]|uniref:Xylanolytic transcriptional activator regulatory domain-containing protein n=1 Tax=Exophiala bonariae TaxID=1690606 RepID=A0AAV9MWP3_9EURO|nr:hypothetical protein LTR84_008585 [Exophiala bonariae]